MPVRGVFPAQGKTRKGNQMQKLFDNSAAHHVQRNINAVDDVAAERSALHAGF